MKIGKSYDSKKQNFKHNLIDANFEPWSMTAEIV